MSFAKTRTFDWKCQRQVLFLPEWESRKSLRPSWSVREWLICRILHPWYPTFEAFLWGSFQFLWYCNSVNSVPSIFSFGFLSGYSEGLQYSRYFPFCIAFCWNDCYWQLTVCSYWLVSVIYRYSCKSYLLKSIGNELPRTLVSTIFFFSTAIW